MANEQIAKVAGAMGITVADFNQLPEKVREGALKMYGDNETLTKAVSGGAFRLGIGTKGGITVSGFGAFPHNYYVDQWVRFAAWLKGDGFVTIDKFIAVNKDKLKSKAAAVVSNQQGAAS
jgi:hypothetical protein